MKNRILLINLGGPREVAEIEKFLTDLFEDPYVFDLPLPEFLRLPLARWIAKKRAPKVAATYESMGFGGGSPLVAETQKQADAIAKVLNTKTGKTWQAGVTMTCGLPDIRELENELVKPGPTNIILPLYPHFSRSTVLSTAKLIQKKTNRCPAGLPGWVKPFHDSTPYLEAIGDLISDFFRGKLNPDDFLHSDSFGKIDDWENLDLVFSAHGIPLRLIKKGDVYRQEIETNAHNLAEILRRKGFRGNYHVSFQSRVGPSKWTEPNTITMLRSLGQRGVKRIAVYPISFVGDHLETLEEIGQQLKEVAEQSGITEYHRIPAPGIYPKFIDAMATLALNSLQEEKKECICKKRGGYIPSKGECNLR
ncbi:ferrochelatase [Leptospira gomenensis]|uniref:Ferrochelatase n=1 Tax=Leptospira gomenensis TaxID=2484974 RepID=A0A5F1YF32_9LEPT|nr:ferrochelatase [Leptospira gomenensis]TGK38385.1 ferrochelatase [Leptospira gomenensis]TGK39306.1 ferrochelatase [Leptospira gomenensis]TGK52199.1 ferrochelatase [Leptospira gomenensis]TGK62947.1 ferrochelatase [Leptospira gomenensis]